MKRDYLGRESQARYYQDSFDAMRSIGDLARDEKAQFIIVCGDVFESNFVERKTILRSLDAIAQIHVPVLILPGNHDPLDPSSIYQNSTFLDNKPSNVTVILDNAPINVTPDVQIIGAPWRSKRPLSDILCDACIDLEPTSGIVRIVVGHGVVNLLSMNRDDPAIIDVPTLEKKISEGAINYVALGDRHSVTCVGKTKRIWYPGSHLATDFGEARSGYVLIVSLGRDCSVQERRLGSWQFVKKDFVFNSDADIENLESYLSSLPDKDTTVIRLGLKGILSVEGRARLDELLTNYRDLYASIEERDEECDLVISLNENDRTSLGLHGFAEETLKKLMEKSKTNGDEGIRAGDAIALLYRLKRGCSE